jgi:hypothetical protein
MHTQFRLEPNVPERNYCVSRGVSILPQLPIKFRSLLRPIVPYKGKSKARLFSAIPAQKSRGCLTKPGLMKSLRDTSRTRHVLLRVTNKAHFTFSLIRPVTCTWNFISGGLKTMCFITFSNFSRFSPDSQMGERDSLCVRACTVFTVFTGARQRYLIAF